MEIPGQVELPPTEVVLRGDIVVQKGVSDDGTPMTVIQIFQRQTGTVYHLPLPWQIAAKVRQQMDRAASDGEVEL